MTDTMEITEHMVGKKVKCRCGRKGLIVGILPDDVCPDDTYKVVCYDFEESDIDLWFVDGRYHGGAESKFDIVGMWEEESQAPLTIADGQKVTLTTGV